MMNLYPLIVIAVVLGIVLNLAAGLVWVERRLLALWQDRYGPNRVGPFGLLQPLADSVKLFTKEDWIPPSQTDRFLFSPRRLLWPHRYYLLPSYRSLQDLSWPISTSVFFSC